jgi:hypothetical protein
MSDSSAARTPYQHHPCPSSLAREWCFVFKLAAERPLVPPGFCNAVANIGHGIPHPTAQIVGSVDVFLASIEGSL